MVDRTQTWTPEQCEHAAVLLREGEHVDTVALELGLDPSLVRAFALDLGELVEVEVARA